MGLQRVGHNWVTFTFTPHAYTQKVTAWDDVLVSLIGMIISLCTFKEMATHFSTLAWKIPWTVEPGRLQSMGSQRVRYDWATLLSLKYIQIIMICTLRMYNSLKIKWKNKMNNTFKLMRKNHFRSRIWYLEKILVQMNMDWIKTEVWVYGNQSVYLNKIFLTKNGRAFWRCCALLYLVFAFYKLSNIIQC